MHTTNFSFTNYMFQNVFAAIDLYGSVETVTVISSAYSEVFNSCSRPPSIPSSESSESLESEYFQKLKRKLPRLEYSKTCHVRPLLGGHLACKEAF